MPSSHSMPRSVRLPLNAAYLGGAALGGTEKSAMMRSPLTRAGNV